MARQSKPVMSANTDRITNLEGRQDGGLLIEQVMAPQLGQELVESYGELITTVGNGLHVFVETPG